MNRKMAVLFGGILAGLAILVVLIWPAAPWLARLGIEPICITGEFPKLRIVSCPQASTTSGGVTPLPLQTTPGQDPIPIIVDDDGSPDGILALLYFLGHPGFDVRAVTVSNGEAHPEVFSPQMARFLDTLERSDIRVGAGNSAPLAWDNAFPDPWRQSSDDFWYIEVPRTTTDLSLDDAAVLIVETVKNEGRPVTIFASGPLTNLAAAMRLDPTIGMNIREIVIMGGSIQSPGNIESDWPEIHNQAAEWNIWVDPVAAREVFNSGVPIRLIPLDATNQVIFSGSDQEDWAGSTSPEGRVAADLLRWLLDSWSPSGVQIWDLVAAVSTSPDACSYTPMAIDVVIADGPEQGRTEEITGPPNVDVCLDPSPERIKVLAASVLGR